MSKIKLELRAYTALSILAFCREFINDRNKNDAVFAAMHESVKEYEDEIYKQTTMNDIDDAVLERSINILTGRQPER